MIAAFTISAENVLIVLAILVCIVWLFGAVRR